MKYWINTVARDHVWRGVDSGFTQANHGKSHMLKRLKKDDWIIFYSPKTVFQNGEPLQAFTAIGQITDDEPYQFEVSAAFMPWRRNVAFKPCIEVGIRPLINDLVFIRDKTHWGYKFRFGVFEINQHDFMIIKDALT